MCWSGDGSTVLLVNRDKDNGVRFMNYLDARIGTVVNDHKPKKLEITFLQDMALDDKGEVVLVLSHWGIDLLTVPKGKRIRHYQCPCPVSLHTQIGYADGTFYILNGGAVIRVDYLSAVIIKDHSNKIGLPVEDYGYNRGEIEWQKSSLSLSGEDLVLKLTSAAKIRTFTISREMDDIAVTEKARWSEGQIDRKHFEMCLSNLRERSIYHINDEKSIELYVHEEGEGEAVYVTDVDSVIGWKIIKSTSRVCKCACRRFVFRGELPTLFFPGQYLKSDRMKKYGLIPDPDPNIVWEEENEEVLIGPNDDREVYNKMTAPPAVIEDREEFTWLTPKGIRNLEWEELGNGRNKSYIAFPTISGRNTVYGGELRENSTHVLLLDENRVLLKEIKGGTRIESANKGRIYYQFEGIIYSVDTKTLEIHEFAEHYPEKNGYVSFVSENGESKLIVLRDRTVHLKTSPNGIFEKIDGICLASENMICLTGDQVVWIQTDKVRRMPPDIRQYQFKEAINILSMDYFSKEKRVANLNFSNLWRPLTMDSDLRISLIRLNSIEKEKDKWWEEANTVSLSFGRLDLRNGEIKEFPNDPEFKLSARLNGPEDIAKVIDWKRNITLVVRDEESYLYKKIALYKISREGLSQSNNAVTPNISKLVTQVTVLGDGRYVISTRESDEDKKDCNNPVFRSELRLMDPKSGRKVRYNLNHSQGQMYGMPNYVIREGSKALSMNNGGYLAAESFGSGGIMINTFDTKTGSRSPKDESKPIMGRIIDKNGETQIKVALAKGNRIAKTALYDLKMRPIEGSEKEMHVPMALNWHQGVYYDNLTTKAICGKEIDGVSVKMAFTGSGLNSTLSEEVCIIIPLRETKPREYSRKAPCPYAAYEHCRGEGRTWVYLKAAIGTLCFGMVSDIIEVDLELVAEGRWENAQVLTGGGSGENITLGQTKEYEEMISECLKNLVVVRIGKTYIIQQPYKKDDCQTELEINCNLRIVPVGGTEKTIEDVIDPWHNWHERKSALMVCREFVSFTQEKNGIARQVVFKGGLDNTECVAYDICDADKYRPESLYADDGVSIALVHDRLKHKMLITSKSKKTEIGLDNNVGIYSIVLLKNFDTGKLFRINEKNWHLNNELEWDSSEVSLTEPGIEIDNTMQLFEERGVFTIVKINHNQ